MMPDFTALAIFKLFDRRASGFLTVGDLSYGFDLLNLKHTTRQSQSFLLAHDLNRDGYLSYPELQSALTPLTPYYADILFSRYPIDLYAVD